MRSLSPLWSNCFSRRRDQRSPLAIFERLREVFGFSPAQTRRKQDAADQLLVLKSSSACSCAIRWTFSSEAKPQRSPLKSDGYFLKCLIASALRCVSTSPQFDRRKLCVSEQIGENEGDSGGAESPGSSGLLINLWEAADAADLQSLQRNRTSAKVNSAMILNILTF